MKSCFAALLFVAFMMVPGQAAAQALWQNVSAGMTRAEVQAAQPQAVKEAGKGHLGDGASCDLHIPSLQIGIDGYQVCFFFLQSKLSQVTLSGLGEPSQRQYEDAIISLTAKYGPPLSEKATSLGRSADWILPTGANISVLFMNRYGNLLNINYQVRKAAELDKF
jgi:hypothetical protein